MAAFAVKSAVTHRELSALGRLSPVVQCPFLQVVHHFFDAEASTDLYQRLIAEQQWPDNHYEVFGRWFTLPRLQTWHADEGIVYSYSDNLLTTRPWTPLLLAVRAQIEACMAACYGDLAAATGASHRHHFNSVLVNYYRDGKDYVGWHSDDEIELGSQPVIASLSLGASRVFGFRRKDNTATEHHVILDSGSLLIMQPGFQHQWQHSVFPDDTLRGRINLTFRYVYPLGGKVPHLSPQKAWGR